jgi:hypothetical protein
MKPPNLLKLSKMIDRGLVTSVVKSQAKWSRFELKSYWNLFMKFSPILQLSHASNKSNSTWNSSWMDQVWFPRPYNENPSDRIFKILANVLQWISLQGWCAPLARNPQWCALLLFLCLWLCRTLLHWCRIKIEWCGRVLDLWDQAWDKLGGIFHHQIVL